MSQTLLWSLPAQLTFAMTTLVLLAETMNTVAIAQSCQRKYAFSANSCQKHGLTFLILASFFPFWGYISYNLFSTTSAPIEDALIALVCVALLHISWRHMLSPHK